MHGTVSFVQVWVHLLFLNFDRPTELLRSEMATYIAAITRG